MTICSKCGTEYLKDRMDAMFLSNKTPGKYTKQCLRCRTQAVTVVNPGRCSRRNERLAETDIEFRDVMQLFSLHSKII